MQGADNRCHSGYWRILYSDMIARRRDDDIHICQKAVDSGENAECFGGYLVCGVYTNTAVSKIFSTNCVLVLKKMHSRIKFSPVYSGCMMVTIINETIGQYIYDSACFSNGQVVELPFSTTMDQIFDFSSIIPNPFFRNIGIGVMMIYISIILLKIQLLCRQWHSLNLFR